MSAAMSTSSTHQHSWQKTSLQSVFTWLVSAYSSISPTLITMVLEWFEVLTTFTWSFSAHPWFISNLTSWTLRTQQPSLRTSRTAPSLKRWNWSVASRQVHSEPSHTYFAGWRTFVDCVCLCMTPRIWSVLVWWTRTATHCFLPCWVSWSLSTSPLVSSRIWTCSGHFTSCACSVQDKVLKSKIVLGRRTNCDQFPEVKQEWACTSVERLELSLENWRHGMRYPGSALWWAIMHRLKALQSLWQLKFTFLHVDARNICQILSDLGGLRSVQVFELVPENRSPGHLKKQLPFWREAFPCMRVLVVEEGVVFGIRERLSKDVSTTFLVTSTFTAELTHEP